MIVGKHAYGTLNVNYYGDEKEFLEIVSYCSIANNVRSLTGGNNEYISIKTYPFKNKISKNAIKEAKTKGEIVLEDDVWIGYGSIILSGVILAKGQL